MKAALIILFILSLAGNYFLFQEREKLVLREQQLSAQVAQLQKEIEVTEELKEEFSEIEAKYEEQIRELRERQNKLQNVLARTDFMEWAKNDPQSLQESIRRANEEWQADYNKLGEQ